MVLVFKLKKNKKTMTKMRKKSEKEAYVNKKYSE